MRIIIATAALAAFVALVAATCVAPFAMTPEEAHQAIDRIEAELVDLRGFVTDHTHPVDPPECVDDCPPPTCEPNCPPPVVEAPIVCPQDSSVLPSYFSNRTDHRVCQYGADEAGNPWGYGDLPVSVTIGKAPMSNKVSILYPGSGGTNGSMANGGWPYAGGVQVQVGDLEIYNGIEWHTSSKGLDGVVRDYHAMRTAAVLDEACNRMWPNRCDHDFGISGKGKSAGAVGILHAVHTLPEPWRSRMQSVWAVQGTNNFDLILQRSNSTNGNTTAGSWLDRVDLAKQVETDNVARCVWYGLSNNIDDATVPWDWAPGPDGLTLPEKLEQHKVAYVLTGAPGGHGGYSTSAAYYPVIPENQFSRPEVAFAGASSNKPYQPGETYHYNLGLEVDVPGITQDPNGWSIPVRYVPRVLPINIYGSETETMAPESTVTMHVRGLMGVTENVTWTLDGDSGSAVTDLSDGVVSITTTIAGGNDWKVLRIDMDPLAP